MIGRIQSELTRFKEILSATQLHHHRIREMFEYAYVIEPVDSLPLPRGKSIGLTVMAITHGNEVGGIAVLNEYLWLVNRGALNLTVPLGIVLGNPLAAINQKRFIDQDLNRSFNKQQNDCHEGKRARELEGLLKETRFLLDIHQTVEPCETGFLIFPYRPESFAFSRKVGGRLPIVTHWNAGFSKDGQCSDEFVNANGGNGITIELGQCGFQPYHVSLGLQAMIRSHEAVNEAFQGSKTIEDDGPPDLYTWGQIFPFTSGETKLDEGWKNFQQIEKGQRLGLIDGKVAKADVSGKILFPKYIKDNKQQRPSELCRIIRRVEMSELENVELAK